MEIKTYSVGNKKVEEISMLDDTTCLLTFETYFDEKENINISTQVEYWIDEESWHYNDLIYEVESGDYIETIESERLDDEDRRNCETLVTSWLNDNGIEMTKKPEENKQNVTEAKIRLNEHFDDYERVTISCNNFIRSVVWESMDVAGGVQENEIERLICAYFRENHKRIISDILKNVREWFDKYGGRYTLHMIERDDNGNIIENSGKHFSSDNLSYMLNLAGKFYREKKHPEVCIYDNVEKKDIVDWK